MSILQQIKCDVETLRAELSTSSKDLVTGEELETVALVNAPKRAELKRLLLILESRIIPDAYYSTVTKEVYYPSPLELKLQSQIIPLVNHSFFCIKNSRKRTGLTESSIKIIRDNSSPIISFLMEHNRKKEYPKGAYALVKKGFSNEPSVKPRWAVKIYREAKVGSSNESHELRLAMRAAYCYKQLGREGFAFRRHDKQYLVTDWLTGVSLVKADPRIIISMPISRRIIMAISLLRELNVLHKQGLIHNDIKADNIMVDYGKLSFVDLDSVRPVNERPLWGLTPIYTKLYLANAQLSYDSEHNEEELYLKFNKKTDITALGWSLILLFPEIYSLKPTQKIVKTEDGLNHPFNSFALHHGPKYKNYPELQKLLKSMTIYNHEDQTLSEEYIEKLYEILPLFCDYQLYLKEDRLIGLGDDLSYEDGEKAFRDIEIELLGYSQRVEAINEMGRLSL